MLCLIAGFGLGMYEHDLRRQIASAVRSLRPDMEFAARFARVRSPRASEALDLYRIHFPEGSLLKKRQMVLIAATACFLLGAVLLVAAITHS